MNQNRRITRAEVEHAEDHDLQEDLLVALCESCWPDGRWVECFVVCDPSAGWTS